MQKKDKELETQKEKSSIALKSAEKEKNRADSLDQELMKAKQSISELRQQLTSAHSELRLKQEQISSGTAYFPASFNLCRQACSSFHLTVFEGEQCAKSIPINLSSSPAASSLEISTSKRFPRTPTST